MKDDVQNILICNIYSWKNKGDAAIILSMLDHVIDQFPHATLTLSTFDAGDGERVRYGDHRYRLNPLAHIVRPGDGKIFVLFKTIWFLFRAKVFEILAHLGHHAFWLFSNGLRAKFKEYESYDLVIAAGGGYLLTRNFWGILPLLVSSYDFYFAKMLNKKYVLYNQSIGPFNNFLHTKLILPRIRNAQHAILREDLSFQRLGGVNLTNLILSADIAFRLKPQETQVLDKWDFSRDGNNIGITVRNWLAEDAQAIYEQELARFIATVLSDDNKARFFFIPQVIFSEMNDDDSVISKKIVDLLPEDYRKRVVVIEDDLHPGALKHVISQMDKFIGTRMHSNIFALSSHVKTINCIL